ncbi:hypothetical protein [Rhodobacter maris]|uniref:Secreted protein n=1 Tax=Rhodobacter maris TaxID=446682 RepID=A0A285RLX2_9RHOB|nr:hypothetical protein [Rhodobacter maris]SOB95115.1 hypothetical protein SAMN05877831_101799 [Rhodobacter maris]
MKALHKIIIVGTTFVLAAATGHVMQNSARYGLDAAPQPSVGPGVPALPETPAVARTLPPGAAAEERIPDLPMPAAGPRLDALLDLARGLPPAQEPASPGFSQDEKPNACARPALRAAPAASAGVELSLSAPCIPGALVTIRHEGLRLPVRLSETGHWSGIVPAMTTKARFAVELPNEPGPEATLAVPDLATVNRVAILSMASDRMTLHGLEYGSQPGGAGDVSAQVPRAPETAYGGWMAVFEDREFSMRTEIYTAPAGMSDIRMTLETEVTPGNCGRDLAAAGSRVLRGLSEPEAWIDLSMPDCDDVTGLVVMPLPDFPVDVAAR